MNVFDFDKTIYHVDSTFGFFRYAMRKKPALLRYLPKVAAGAALYFMKIGDRDRAKGLFMSYFEGLDDLSLIEQYWDEHIDGIYPWYLAVQQEDDLVISASAEQIVGPACRRLGIKNLIATQMDSSSGRLLRSNCKGQQKVEEFRQVYGDAQIDRFYSDSLSDTPLARLAKESYLIVKGKPVPWPEMKTEDEKVP